MIALRRDTAAGRGDTIRRRDQKRPSFPSDERAIQKFTPSLQTPNGFDEDGSGEVPMSVRSVAR